MLLAKVIEVLLTQITRLRENNIAFVYWIHLNAHTDITREGYVGVSAKTVARRFVGHKSAANTGSQLHVHRAMRKYGEDVVVTTILEGSEDYCYLMENRLRPTPDLGWNHAVGGMNAGQTGRTHSEEARKKISLAHTGKIVSKETRANMSKAFTGRKLPQSAKEKIRVAATGRVRSQESCEKHSKAMAGRVEWENSAARKDLWAVADVFYDAVKNDPASGARTIAERLNFLNCHPWKLVAKLKSGWNPTTDPRWLEFSAQYKVNEQESHEQQEETTEAY